jgi:hypothetical protein
MTKQAKQKQYFKESNVKYWFRRPKQRKIKVI